MNKLKAVLLGIALTVPFLMTGCDPKSVGPDSIEVVSVRLEDWTDPKDGKVYVVALPTWKNNGKVAVRQVTFMAEVKGLDEAKQPKGEVDEPQFYGAVVEPGTTVEPAKVPGEGVILGLKEELKDVKPDSVQMVGVPSDKEYIPPKKSDA